MRQIGWVNEELNTFESTPSYRNHPSLAHVYYQTDIPLEPSRVQSTWGSKNSGSYSYRYFFSSEDEWRQSLKQISDYRKAYYGTMNNGGRISCAALTSLFGNLCKRSKNEIEKGINDSKSSLELKIGAKLMNLMERL